jgi:multiple sugar transport system permease protein
MAGFFLFALLLMLFAVFVSFMDINNLKNMASLGHAGFAGLTNFKQIIHDAAALHAYLKSIVFSAIYVPVMIVVSLLLALLMNRNYFAKNLTNTLIFMPYVSNIVAISLVMSFLLDPTDGPINQILMAIGISADRTAHGVDDHRTDRTAWQGLAFYIIVYTVALRNVPKDYYEAAAIDGATASRRLVGITMPLISPTTFMLTITAIIGSFQNYALIKNLTNGGPGDATTDAVMNIFTEAFQYNHFSYATAQAIVLFAFCLLITLVQWKGQQRWVHY